jgi:hypothetical protein
MSLKIPKFSIVPDCVLKASHQFQIVFFVLGIQLAIAVFGVAMVADRQFGISQAVPVEADTSNQEAGRIGKIGGAQTCDQVDQAQGFPCVITNIEVFMSTDRTLINHVALLE